MKAVSDPSRVKADSSKANLTPCELDLPPACERAQRAHHARSGAFVACEDATPRPLAQVGRASRPWTGGACWEELGWEPEGPSVRGTYWVQVQGDALTVHGAIDADGDGQPDGKGHTRAASWCWANVTFPRACVCVCVCVRGTCSL